MTSMRLWKEIMKTIDEVPSVPKCLNRLSCALFKKLRFFEAKQFAADFSKVFSADIDLKEVKKKFLLIVLESAKDMVPSLNVGERLKNEVLTAVEIAISAVVGNLSAEDAPSSYRTVFDTLCIVHGGVYTFDDMPTVGEIVYTAYRAIGAVRNDIGLDDRDDYLAVIEATHSLAHNYVDGDIKYRFFAKELLKLLKEAK